MGAYLFFAICNVCNKIEGTEAIPVVKGRSLYLEINDSSDATTFVDVFTPVDRFINNNLKYDKDAETMVIIVPEAIINSIKNQIPSLSMRF